MALDIEQTVKLTFESSGFYDVMNGISNYVFYNDEESKRKIKDMSTKVGTGIDRGEIVKEISTMIEDRIAKNEGMRKENVIQTILMIATNGQKRKKRR